MKDIDHYRLLMVPAVTVVALDQVTKALVLRMFPIYYQKVIVPGLFNIVHVRNTGGAFSLFSQGDSALHRWAFIAIGLAALAVIAYLYRQTSPTDFSSRLGLGLIFGGAVGNLIDRLRFGEVVDFLDFYLGSHHWPAFNVADTAISLGAFTIIYALLRPQRGSASDQ